MFTKLIGSVMMLLLLSAVVVQAQQVDMADNVNSTPALLDEQIAIDKISTYGGPSDAIIFDNGPFITHPTGGFGGAAASALQASLGLSIFGFGAQQTAGNSLIDDFVVPGGTTWTLNTITFYTYQTGSTTTSTITGAYVQIWNTDPCLGGVPIWGSLTTPVSFTTSFTGSYRVHETALTANNRPIMDVVANVATCPVLGPGTYWVQASLTGSLASGPWFHPVTILGQQVTGNGQQQTATACGPALSGVDPNTYQQAIPFKIDGTATAITCPIPSNQGVTNITLTSASLTWTSNSGLSDIEFGLAGFPPTGFPTYASVTGPYPVSPLLPATPYSFYVRDNCGANGYSDWLGPYTFSTFCAPCPPGSTAEGEAQLPNGSDGSGINGGCAVSQPLLTSPIALGQTYCGQSNTFLNNLGANARDNDYYYLDLNTPTCIYWNLVITLQGNSLVNVTLFDAGDMTCNIGAVTAVSTTSACEVATINVDVPSGNYYVVARVATAAGNLWPVGSGPWQYVLTVNGTQVGAPNLDPNPPAEIVAEVPPAGTYTQNIPMNNIGTYDLEYAASTTGAYSTVFADNFDTYVAGLQLAGQSGGNWTTWGGTSGGADDGFVSSAQSLTAPNSFLVTPNIDQVHLFGDLNDGVYRISFYNYIVSGKAGYFNILSDFTFGTGGYWAVDMYFNVDGTIDVVSNHTTITAPFNWTAGEWKKIEVIVDLDNDVAEAIYDGQSIYQWPWSEGGSTGTGQLIIDAIDFFGATADDEMYVDNFLVEVAGLDWLTLNSGLGVSAVVAPATTGIPITVGINGGSKPVGVYNKVINLVTNELCGAKNNYVIPVTMYHGWVLYGNIYYGHTGITKPQVTTTSVTLTPGSTQNAGAGGSYRYRALAPGVYNIIGASGKAWTGLNSPDPTLAQRYILNLTTLTDLQKRAADVNLTGTVQAIDVTMMKRRILTQPYPQWVKPNEMVWDGPFVPGWHGVSPTWIQTGAPVTVGSNVNHDVRCLFTGDVNNSANPTPIP